MKIYTASDTIPKMKLIYAIYRHPQHITPRLDMMRIHSEGVVFGEMRDEKGWIPMGFVIASELMDSLKESGYNDKAMQEEGKNVAWAWYDERKFYDDTEGRKDE